MGRGSSNLVPNVKMEGKEFRYALVQKEEERPEKQKYWLYEQLTGFSDQNVFFLWKIYLG